MLKEIRIGVSLVIITAVISGLANFYNKFAMKILAVDSFQYTTLKNAIVALIISAIVLTPWILPKLKKLTKKDWLNLAIIGLVGGSVPFLLFFKGLSLTSSVSASFIHKTLFFWVAILAWPFLREKISKLQFLALGILLLGNVIFESFRGLSWGLPETLILAATLLWAIETVIAKKVLANLDSIVLAWGRMFFGA
ncbi:MAG: DMT family transporter, partial [Candidatus Buchananbacteria bacterium]